MEKKIIITYRWWRDEEGEILDHHKEALEESAEKRINEMRVEGYTSGELCDNVFMHDTDIEKGEEGISYSGWWEVTAETSY